MEIDTPKQGATITQPFAIAGWTADFGASQNAGIDTVHVWVYPDPGSGRAPVFVGADNALDARADVAAAFGPQYLHSGYGVVVNGLAPGLYQFVAYAHSTVSGTFNVARTTTVTVAGRPPLMSIDVPGNQQSSSRTFAVAGWAFDPNSASGSGVDAIHVWAYPVGGGNPLFVGAGTLGYARPDVAAVFGPVGTTSGYGLIGTLPAGTWDLAVYAHSTATDTFNNWQVVRIVVK
jgi:hypothetical protein